MALQSTMDTSKLFQSALLTSVLLILTRASIENVVANADVDSQKLTEAQIAAFKEDFSLYDVDGDGSITGKEMEAFWMSLGEEAKPKTDHMTAEFDADGNGYIDIDEFVTMIAGEMKEFDPEEAFNVFDEDQNRYINFAELRQAMKYSGAKPTDQKVDERLREFDIDDDKQLNHDEFVKMMASMQE